MSIHDRQTNERYSNFLLCTEEAPEGTYQRAKDIAIEIGMIADLILERTRVLGVPVCNSDGIRNIEVAIYREMVDANADYAELVTAEGFGAAMRDPTVRGRIMSQTIRDRDFLKSMVGA